VPRLARVGLHVLLAEVCRKWCYWFSKVVWLTRVGPHVRLAEVCSKVDRAILNLYRACLSFSLTYSKVSNEA
jgi:hypothetical protein